MKNKRYLKNMKLKILVIDSYTDFADLIREELKEDIEMDFIHRAEDALLKIENCPNYYHLIFISGYFNDQPIGDYIASQALKKTTAMVFGISSDVFVMQPRMIKAGVIDNCQRFDIPKIAREYREKIKDV